VTAPHFFVGPTERLLSGDRIRLSAEDSVHALRSRRLRPGEAVTFSDGVSWLGRGRLVGEEGGRATIEVAEAWPIPRREPELTVSLAPPKGPRLAWAVQKLAELGVGELRLMETERSVRSASASGLARLAVVAREAAMQSAQPSVMGVSGQEGLEEAVADVSGVGVMLHEGASDRINGLLPDGADHLHLLVGPEGGFSDSEVALAMDTGFRVASLGPAILRTETAAVVGAALMLARYGRLG
jgi:16S rRNA (uracil1498-N3)-methyltransferase